MTLTSPQKSTILIQLHYDGNPLRIIRIEKRNLLRLFYSIGLFVIMLFLGTLMFFREIEINRKLEEKLLMLESKQKLHEMINKLEASIPIQERELANNVTETKAVVNHLVSTESISKITEFVGTKIVNFSTECIETSCTVKLSMIPISQGTTKGSLLIILETHLPTSESIAAAKRYFIYPEQADRDDISQKDLLQLKRKEYQFSRILNVSTQFNIGKLLKPIAINVYLFDMEGNNTLHERKLLESGEK